jgi:plasmid stability protein
LQCASIKVVTTLYIRDVSEEVAETLKQRAAADGKSVSAYVGGELAKIAARPTNAEVAARLNARDRSNGPSADEIVAAVQAHRR